jgi:hypothetical protein
MNMEKAYIVKTVHVKIKVSIDHYQGIVVAESTGDSVFSHDAQPGGSFRKFVTKCEVEITKFIASLWHYLADVF